MVMANQLMLIKSQALAKVAEVTDLEDDLEQISFRLRIP